ATCIASSRRTAASSAPTAATPALVDETGHRTVPADCPVPVESERHAGREVERRKPNPSGMQAARWTGASRIRAACRPRGGRAQAEPERHAGREMKETDIE